MHTERPGIGVSDLPSTMPATTRRLVADGDAGRWYALCGTRLYCIETLAGTFPDMGWHQPQEMGGIWSPPIKLLDGYWIGLRRPGGELHWLHTPQRWELGDDGVTFTYEVPDLDLRATRRAWIVPDEPLLVVDLTLTARTPLGDQAPAPVEVVFAVRSDLQGAWRSEEQLGRIDGDDTGQFSEDLQSVVIWDTRQPHWSVCVGATASPLRVQVGQDVWGPERTTGRGTGAALWYRCAVGTRCGAGARRESLRVVIAGPARNGQPASTLFARWVRTQPTGLQSGEMPTRLAAAGLATPGLDEAQRAYTMRFAQPFDACVLHSPDAALDDAFAWSKAAASWMMLDVPGLGRAPMGGLADFPWWFGCDTAYGVLALLPFGQGHEAAASLRTLAQLSRRRNGNARVLHEVVSNGVIVEPGNLVEVPLFARALYHTYRWTGDRALLEQLFPFCLDGVLSYALGSELESGECVPQGRSMAETPEAHGGVQALDVGAYLIEALELLSELAHELDRSELAADLCARAERMRDTMRAEWWLASDGLFGELRASASELTALLARFEALESPDESVRLSIQRLRAALALPEATAGQRERRQLWRFGHFLHVLAAEAGLPTHTQAEQLLARLESPEWTTPHGVVLNALTDRRVMTLPTGAMAVAEARYGRADAALSYIQRLTATMGQLTPGTMSEFSPAAGCFLQFWSSYGVIWPIVHAIFGVRPDVASRRVLCAPNMPRAWPRARLEAIPLGDAHVACECRATARGMTVRLTTTDPTWDVTMGAVVPAEAASVAATLNGMPVALRRAPESVTYSVPMWVADATSGATEYTLAVTWATASASGGQAAP